MSNRVSPSSPLFPLQGPVIPDPDYSLSDEENEQVSKKTCKTNIWPLSGSRRGSVISQFSPHSIHNNTIVTADDTFTNSHPDEIDRVPSLLASASHPTSVYTPFVSNAVEDGDNSSSGVSSDQEVITATWLGGTGDISNNNQILPSNMSSPSNRAFLSFMPLPGLHSTDVSDGMDAECKENEFVVLPPPEFVSNEPSSLAPSMTTTVEVLEPPPQFSDCGTC